MKNNKLQLSPRLSRLFSKCEGRGTKRAKLQPKPSRGFRLGKRGWKRRSKNIPEFNSQPLVQERLLPLPKPERGNRGDLEKSTHELAPGWHLLRAHSAQSCPLSPKAEGQAGGTKGQCWPRGRGLETLFGAGFSVTSSDSM